MQISLGSLSLIMDVLPDPQPDPSFRYAFTESIVVFAAAYIFLLITQTENFSAAHDSITYLVGIVNGEQLFHPHHLLYHVLARDWLMFWKAVFPAIPDYSIVTAFTSLWGSACLALVWAIFRTRFGHRVATALSATSIIAFSYGTWFYSANIEVYMPAIFFMLLLLHAIPEKLSRNSVLLLAVLHSLAILFHQVNILFAVFLLYYFIRQGRPFGVARALGLYVGTGLLLVGGMYFYGGWIAEGHQSMEKWITWIRGYTYGHDYWRPWTTETPVMVATGIAHALIGGHFLFQIPQVNQRLSGSLAEHSLQDELYLSSAIDPAMAWFLSGLCIALLILIGILIWRFIRQKAWHSPPAARFFSMGAGWAILLYSLFFSFWMPEILEFWILQLMLFWLLLLGGVLQSTQRKHVPSTISITVVVALILFAVNYFGSMRWLSSKTYDYYRKQTEALNIHLNPGDLVVLEDPWILDGYICYFTPARALQAAAFREKRFQKEGFTGGRIFYITKGQNPDRGKLENDLSRKFGPETLYLPGGEIVLISEE